jgi:beta-glucanase (GH16 family)
MSRFILSDDVQCPSVLQYDTTLMQSNYFRRLDRNITSPSTGNEQIHNLGFDASKDFHMYGFRWTGDDSTGTGGGIEWFVDGKSVRKVTNQTMDIPDARYTYLRTMANVWVVGPTAMGWAGIPPSPDRFPTSTSSQYKWMMYTEAFTDDTSGRSTCVMPASC